MIEALRNLIFVLFRHLQRRRAESLVLSAEVISHYTGVYSIEIIKEIYEKEEKNNEYLRRILDKYKKAKPKYEVYDEIFEKEFLQILRMAEEKRVPVSGVFKDYSEIKTKVEKAKKKIISAVVRPLVIFLIAAVIVYWAIGNMAIKMSGMKGVDLSSVMFVYKFYWLIMGSIPVVILLSLFKFPRKVPFLKKAYQELDGFQLLSLCKMFLSMGISTIEIVNVFRKVMKVDVGKKFLKGMEQEEKGIESLIEILRKYLSKEEAIALKVAGQTYEYERAINSMVEKRSIEFESKIDAVVSVLGEVLVLVSMIPVGMLLMAILTILAGVSSSIRF